MVGFLPTETDSTGTASTQADLAAPYVREAIDAAPFGLALFTVPAGTTTEPDRHASHELWLVRAGRGLVCCGDAAFEVSPEQLVAIRGGEVHRLVAGDEDVEVLSLWWSVQP